MTWSVQGNSWNIKVIISSTYYKLTVLLGDSNHSWNTWYGQFQGIPSSWILMTISCMPGSKATVRIQQLGIRYEQYPQECMLVWWTHSRTANYAEDTLQAIIQARHTRLYGYLFIPKVFHQAIIAFPAWPLHLVLISKPVGWILITLLGSWPKHQSWSQNFQISKVGCPMMKGNYPIYDPEIIEPSY